VLNSLRVSNFRAFKNLEVNRLGRVNLVVGRNNVGKTTFLEAVHLYSSGDIIAAIIRLLRRRQEYSLQKNRPTVFFSNLFYQDAAIPLPIEIGEKTGENQLVIRSTWRWVEENIENEGETRIKRQMVGDNPPENLELESTEVLSVRRGKGTVQFASVESGQYSGRFPGIHEDYKNSLLLPSSGFQDDSINVSELWDQVVLTDKENAVLDALRVIEPDLERMAMVQRKGTQGIAMVKLRQKKNMPLLSLGEGMNKLFELALGLVNTGEGGTFLVDEIDSGLHYTTLVDVWRLVFRTAVRLKVQVFATTHSWDCIKAFQEAAVEHPSDGMLIRLERSEEDIRAELFSEKDLTIITRESIEVR